jgi:hypothetical protein
MKMTPLLSAIVAFASVQLPSAFAGAAIPISTEKVLQIVVHDNVIPRNRDSWTSPRQERDRYLEFKEAIEAAVKAADYKGVVKVTEFAAGIPDEEQRLTIYIYRWEKGLESFGSSFTAEFTMEAVLQVGEKEYDMGSFSARESHVAMGGPEPEDFRPVARRAIDQMIEHYRNAIAKAG